LSRDGKATVKLGAFSRGGKPRGEYKASAHDLGETEKDVPCGILDADTAQLSVTCGRSAKPRVVIVATRTAWGAGLTVQEQGAIEQIHLKRANGPERSGVRTQLLQRLGQLLATSGKPGQLLSSPPYHRT
jgi:hypothetical protein